MTPSHATSPNKRYRYYVTRPDEVDGSPARRVPAHDLEQLVCGGVASRLTERGSILDLQGEGELAAAGLQQVLARADLAAATLRSGTDDKRIEILSTLVQRINLAEDSASITLSAAGLDEALGTAAALQPETHALIITVPAVRVRRGQQMRLVVPVPESNDQPPPVRRDDRLIGLVAEALQARELVLAYPGRSLSSLAAEHGKCRTRLGKLVGLSCLAPDIITAIAEGRQPETLTTRRLDVTVLPLEWAQQKRVLRVR